MNFDDRFPLDTDDQMSKSGRVMRKRRRKKEKKKKKEREKEKERAHFSNFIRVRVCFFIWAFTWVWDG